MADIVLIKIGQNEPETYSKASQISKSFDIVDVLPRRRDTEGKLLIRDAGEIGRKRFFQLNVDMSHLTDEKLLDFRSYLTRGEDDCKRILKVHLDNYSEIKQETKDALSLQAVKCLSKKSLMDVSTITRLDKIVSFDAFISMVINKKDNTTLKRFLPKEFINGN